MQLDNHNYMFKNKSVSGQPSGTLKMRVGFLFFSSFCLLIFAGGGVGTSAELVMFESDSCEWCEAWHAEVGVIYAKTAEARIAPLRRVDIDDPMPAELSKIRGIRYTPTFVVMQDGGEVGRILGYPGEDFFWGLLNVEFGKLKSEKPNAVPACVEKSERERLDEKSGDNIAAC